MSDYAARIRAARAYKGLKQEELAERLGVDTQTIKRREAGTQNPKRGELLAIAAITGVPPSFMENGFGEAQPSEILERLDRIEAALAGGEGPAGPVRDYARGVINELRPGAVEPGAPAPTAPPDDDLRQAESSAPRARSRRRS